MRISIYKSKQKQQMEAIIIISRNMRMTESQVIDSPEVTNFKKLANRLMKIQKETLEMFASIQSKKNIDNGIAGTVELF